MIFSDFNKSESERDFDNECSKARAKAISYIGISKKTSIKVSGWLKEKGYPDSVIDFVINDLKQEKVIDDKSIALKIIDRRRGRYSESKRALEYRLQRLGIPKNVAIECINEKFIESKTEENDANLLLHLKFSDKVCKIHQCDYTQKQKFQQKCYRFLMARGYSSSIAYRATKNLMKEDFIDEQNY